MLDSQTMSDNVGLTTPRGSGTSMSSNSSTPRSGRSIEDVKGNTQQRPPRRQHTLSLGSTPISPTSPSEDDAVTPTPNRPNMSEREHTLRPLSHSSSAGNLREQANNDQYQHPRSATVSVQHENTHKSAGFQLCIPDQIPYDS